MCLKDIHKLRNLAGVLRVIGRMWLTLNAWLNVVTILGGADVLIGLRSHVADFERLAERGDDSRWMGFFDWVSLAWYHVVGTGNVNHFLAGCRVEKIRTWGGVLSYCAKYMSKADSENWMADVPAGRSWGIFNRAFMPWAKLVTIPLTDDVGNRVRRI